MIVRPVPLLVMDEYGHVIVPLAYTVRVSVTVRFAAVPWVKLKTEALVSPMARVATVTLAPISGGLV